MALLLAALLVGRGDGNLDSILGGSPGAAGAVVDTGAVNQGRAAGKPQNQHHLQLRQITSEPGFGAFAEALFS